MDIYLHSYLIFGIILYTHTKQDTGGAKRRQESAETPNAMCWPKKFNWTVSQDLFVLDYFMDLFHIGLNGLKTTTKTYWKIYYATAGIRKNFNISAKTKKLNY